MATSISNWSYDKVGNVVVTYTDKTTKVFTEQEAIKQGIIKDPGTLGQTKGTSTVSTGKVASIQPTPQQKSAAGSYGSGATDGALTVDPVTNMPVDTSNAVPIKDPKTGAITWTSISNLIYAADDPKRLAEIQKTLIANNLLSKTNKDPNAVKSKWLQVLYSSSRVSMDPNDWMKELKASGFGPDTTGAAAGPLVMKYAHNYGGSTGDALFRSEFSKVFNRNPTAQDYVSPFKDSNGKPISWVTVLANEAKKPANYTTVARNADGSLSTTTDPFDAATWLNGQLTNTYGKAIQAGTMTAEQSNIDKYIQLADQYGVNVIDPNTKKLLPSALMDLSAIETNTKKFEDVQKGWSNVALAQYGAPIQTQLSAGLSLKQAAQPAIDIIAKVLEKDPSSISLTDPLVQKYLKGDGKSTLASYQIESMARQQPEWQFTNNAHAQFDSLSTDIMKRFGVIG
jgi:hypothetical protein